jgi:DnaJ-class molecular chaperone
MSAGVVKLFRNNPLTRDRWVSCQDCDGITLDPRGLPCQRCEGSGGMWIRLSLSPDGILMDVVSGAKIDRDAGSLL